MSVDMLLMYNDSWLSKAFKDYLCENLNVLEFVKMLPNLNKPTKELSGFI